MISKLLMLTTLQARGNNFNYKKAWKKNLKLSTTPQKDHENEVTVLLFVPSARRAQGTMLSCIRVRP